jgi:hypothetical protein
MYHAFYTTKYRIRPPGAEPVYLTLPELEAVSRAAFQAARLPVGPYTLAELTAQPGDRRLLKRLARKGVLTRWLHGYTLCQSVRTQITRALQEATA